MPETKIESNREYADFDAVIMEGVGHFLHLEKPEAFNEALREVLAGLESNHVMRQKQLPLPPNGGRGRRATDFALPPSP